MQKLSIKSAIKQFNESKQPFQFKFYGNRKISTTLKNTYGIDSYKSGDGSYITKINNKILHVVGVGYNQVVTIMSLEQFKAEAEKTKVA